ncbi:MAG: winged helix-turn-helix domain-containing protein, partial [Acidobacteriota bacterium]
MRYVHGKFELHKASRRLYFDGEPVQISQRGIDILLHLIELNGALASKKELLEAIWPGEAALESRLVKQISLLRRSMENISPESSIIVTIPGLGYRVERWEVRFPTAPTGEQPESVQLQAPVRTDPPPVVRTNPASDPVLALVDLERPFKLGGWFRHHRRQIIFAFPVLLFSTYVFLSIVSQVEVHYKFGPSGIISARTRSGFKRSLQISHDGRALTYYQSPDPDGAGQLLIVNLANNDTVTVPGTWSGDDAPAWSPDNRSLALLRPTAGDRTRRELFLSSRDGQQIRRIGEVEAGGVDWDPDGLHLAVCESPAEPLGTDSGSTLIHLLKSDGSTMRPVTQRVDQRLVIDSQPHFSPDGSRIAFLRRHVADQEEIYLVDLASGELRQLTSDRSHITDLDWSPNGREILFISNRSGAPHLWRVTTVRTAGTLRPDLVEKITDPLRSFSLSETGELAYVCLPGNNSQIDVVPLPQSPLASLINREKRPDYLPCTISSSNSTYSPAFSPSVSEAVSHSFSRTAGQIAFISTLSGNGEIWVANADCTKQRQVTFLNQANHQHLNWLNWSGDGTRIAFSQTINGQSDIFSLELSSGRIDRLTDTPGNESRPVWSRSGGKAEVIYYSWKTGTRLNEPAQIRRLDLALKQTDTLVESCEGRF